MLLMHRDNVVYDFSSNDVKNSSLLPYIYAPNGLGLANDLIVWLNHRATTIKRKHADKIYESMGIPRDGAGLQLMRITHGLSINDNYWITDTKISEGITWKDINLFNNKLSETLSYMALTGTPISIAGDHISPEFTGRGTYAKCICREQTGLVLYKAGTNFEIWVEVFASLVANQLGIRSAQYYKSNKFGINTVASPICTNEKVSWISAFDSTKFFEQNFGMNVYDFAATYFPLPFYQMVVLDGLILNPDRHLQNWSFELDGYTNQLLGLAPCYDYNRAFTATRTDMSREIPHHNLLSAAREAFPKSGIDENRMIGLIGLVGNLPKHLQDSFYNRVLYIIGKKSSQDNCF